MKEIPLIHQNGVITIENLPEERGFVGDLGIQRAKDGKLWICINGQAFLRFTPERKKNS